MIVRRVVQAREFNLETSARAMAQACEFNLKTSARERSFRLEDLNLCCNQESTIRVQAPRLDPRLSSIIAVRAQISNSYC